MSRLHSRVNVEFAILSNFVERHLSRLHHLYARCPEVHLFPHPEVPPTARDSPFLKVLKKKGRSPPRRLIDEYTITQLKEFHSKKLVCVSKEGLQLEETEEKVRAGACRALHARPDWNRRRCQISQHHLCTYSPAMQASSGLRSGLFCGKMSAGNAVSQPVKLLFCL